MSSGTRQSIVRRIDHVGVAVLDIDAAVTYYTDVLGMRLSGDALLADGSARLAYLDAADTTIQLVQPLRSGPLADFLATNGEGLHHICLEVTGRLETALRDVFHETSDGISIGGRDCRVSFVSRKPNNVLIEVTEQAPQTTGPSPKAGAASRDGGGLEPHAARTPEG